MRTTRSGSTTRTSSGSARPIRSLLRRADGTLIGKVGLVFVDIEAGREAFSVAGVGGVIVTHSERGKGLLRPLLEAALERAVELGAERAMLFCAERNVGLYERFGFAVIEAPVIAQQPSGPLVMPMPAMWRPLREGVTWPVGVVSLPGPPF